MKKVANIVFNSFLVNNYHYIIKNIYNWEEQEKILIDIYQDLDL